MKTMFLLFTFFFFASSCGEEKQPEPQENSIYGTWQLVEQWLGNVGDTSVNWSEISDGKIIIFYRNNLFYSSTAKICSTDPLTSGRYKVVTNDRYNFVEISLSCNEGEFNQKEVFSFENNYLILSPIDVCDEGCSFKFKKISS